MKTWCNLLKQVSSTRKMLLRCCICTLLLSEPTKLFLGSSCKAKSTPTFLWNNPKRNSPSNCKSLASTTRKLCQKQWSISKLTCVTLTATAKWPLMWRRLIPRYSSASACKFGASSLRMMIHKWGLSFLPTLTSKSMLRTTSRWRRTFLFCRHGTWTTTTIWISACLFWLKRLWTQRSTSVTAFKLTYTKMCLVSCRLRKDTYLYSRMTLFFSASSCSTRRVLFILTCV